MQYDVHRYLIVVSVRRVVFQCWTEDLDQSLTSQLPTIKLNVITQTLDVGKPQA